MGPFIVLGMHRGGTSLVASILISLGVNMGDSFPAINRHNPWGYWEDTDFMRLNSRILRAAGGKWDKPPTQLRIMQAGHEQYADDIRTLLARKASKSSGKGQRWGWKDPRTCLTMPLYAEVLTNPYYVVVKRSPSEIVHSLSVRHRGSKSKRWELLTTEYLGRLNAFIKTTDRPVHYVEFKNLLNSRERANEIVKLGWFIGLTRFGRRRDKAVGRIQTPHDTGGRR